jgi:hypothetical protein
MPAKYAAVLPARVSYAENHGADHRSLFACSRQGICRTICHNPVPGGSPGGSQPYVYIHAVDSPFPLPEQGPQPLKPEARPLGPAPPLEHLPHGSLRKALGRRPEHGGNGGVEVAECRARVASEIGDRGIGAGYCGGGGPGLEPVAAEVEETAVGPVAGGEEENEEEYGAVDAGPVEKVCADEEEEDEGGGGVGRDEEEGEPAARNQSDGDMDGVDERPLPSETKHDGALW